MPGPVLGHPVLSGAACSRDARCPVGLPGWWDARCGTSGAGWGCPVLRRPRGGSPGAWRGCQVPGCPEAGGRGRGAVLTTALEALPAAAPDEVSAEIAPGVQPAAARLEAVPGARCRRQPRVRMRPGAGPAGRADAQRVGSFQAAPARPRLRLQLPQLDELHGPAAAGAARRDGGRHRAEAGAGTGRGRLDRGPRETEAGEAGGTARCLGLPIANSSPGEPGGAGWRRG